PPEDETGRPGKGGSRAMRRREQITRWACCAGAMFGGLMVLVSRPAAAQVAIRVTLNGAQINFGDAEPEEVGNRVLVPLRGVFEAMGAQVDYFPATQKIVAKRDNTQVELTIDSVRATVNGQERTL